MTLLSKKAQPEPATEIKAYRFLPIDPLPTEVLQDIFVLVIPFEISKERNIALCRLTWVSSRWRRIVRRLPFLWSSLAISVSVDIDFEWKWRMVDEWIQLSGNRHLSFALSETPACRLAGPRRYLCTTLHRRVLRRYSERIHYLEGVTPYIFRNISRSPLQNLHSLVFDNTSKKFNPLTLLSSLPSFSPNLRRLGLHDNMLYLRNLRSIPSLTNLTHLSTSLVLGFGAWMQTLSVFPNLQVAIIHYDSIRPGPPSDPDHSTIKTITLPRLTSLTVFFASTRFMDIGIFLHLNMPLLKTLRLGSFSLGRFTTASFTEEVMEGIYHRLKTVRHLSLIFSYLSGSDILNFLHYLPDLETLDIQECLDFEKLIFDFREMQKRSLIPFLPSLRRITYDIRQPIDIDFAGLRDDLTTFALRRLPDSDAEQDSPENSLHIEFYFGELALHMHPLVEASMCFEAQSLSRSFVFWNEGFGNRENRWKYRLEGENGKWIEGVK